MRKFAFTAMMFAFAIALQACSILGFDNQSVPIIATHSGADAVEESDPRFVELSKPDGGVSSDVSVYEESSCFESRPEESFSEPFEESSEEESELPAEMSEYEYEGFYVKGFEKPDIVGIVSSVLETVNNASAHVSVYYEDIKSGYTLSYDAERTYKAGSVTKAPYCKYLIASGVDLDEKLALKNSDKMDGSGSLKNQPSGGEYTVKRLIEYAVKESDNTAYKMLYGRFGFDGFNEYCDELGVGVRLNTVDVWGDLSAYDAAKFFADIYEFEKEDPRSGFFMESLRNATYIYLLPSGLGRTPTAHKFGYMSGSYKVLHDVGIVYTDDPFILVVMTDFNPSGGNGRSTFTQISADFKAFATSK